MTTAEKLAQLDAHSARVLRCGGPKADVYKRQTADSIIRPPQNPGFKKRCFLIFQQREYLEVLPLHFYSRLPMQLK